jgi:hypothetical protein
MGRLLLALVVMLCTQTIIAQTIVKGSVLDTAEKKPLSNAVVSLLYKKDSMLYKFTRTDKSGAFQLHNVQPGTYTLLVTYPKFADFADDITVKTNPTDLGSIAMTERAQLLQAVIIRSAGSIRIKGDTTEFVADSFKVREGATVEELLKKLPGFQVNSKGEITAQGQRVQKVLVDGEEFFGDDPTMATKNIAAKAVDKVQVFDTKTDQQAATGVTRGDEGKTVNIKLKEDQKKGGFGRYWAASNFKNYHDANLVYNRFVNKKKISVYGTKSNTTTGSLNWEDRRKLGLENDFDFDEAGGFYYSFDNDDEFSNWTLRGLPDAYTAGGLYSNKWNSDQQSLNGSYRYNRLGTRNIASTFTQNILPDTLFYTNQYSNTRGLNQQHAVNFKYEWKLDSLSTLKFSSASLRKTNKYENSTTTESLSEEKVVVNNGERTNDGENTRLQSDNALQYKRLFKKQGRQLVAQVRFNYVEDQQNFFLRYTNRFYKGAQLDSLETADQLKQNFGHSNTLGGKLTFIEPLGTKYMLVGEYSYNHNAATSDQNTFDRSASGKYEDRSSLYSNNFDMNVANHSGSLMVRYKYKKTQLALGNRVSAVQLNLLNRDNNQRTHYNFLNLRPQANFRFNLRQSEGFGFNYSGATVQPSLTQLQPLRNNLDPLNLVVGNPNLKVGFRNQFNTYFNSYKMLSETNLYLSVNYNFTTNAIANATTISAGGKKTTQPVNVDGVRDVMSYIWFSKGNGQNKVSLRVNGEFYGGRGVNFVNSLRNETNYMNAKLRIGGYNEKPEKWNIQLMPEIGYNTSTSSLNKSTEIKYYSFGGNMEGWTKLPGGFEINTNLELNLQQRISAFATNPNIVLWNGELSHKILKKGAGKLSLLANDILKTNRGFNRNINTNFITEERYQRIGQYFMLKFEWSFNKMGGEQ